MSLAASRSTGRSCPLAPLPRMARIIPLWEQLKTEHENSENLLPIQSMNGLGWRAKDKCIEKKKDQRTTSYCVSTNFRSLNLLLDHSTSRLVTY